jgi:hypothetical protein
VPNPINDAERGIPSVFRQFRVIVMQRFPSVDESIRFVGVENEWDAPSVHS